jgi:predicted dehydrogenase
VFPTCLKLHNPERTETETLEPDFPTGPVPHTIEGLEPMYGAQLAYFVDCIRTGRQPNPGGQEGWVNMRIVESAYRSAQTGQLVNL